MRMVVSGVKMLTLIRRATRPYTVHSPSICMRLVTLVYSCRLMPRVPSCLLLLML